MGSDVAAFIGHTRNALELGQDQIVTITPAGATVINFDGSPAEGKHYVWEQELEGTPFAKHLRSARVEIGLRPREAGTEVSIASVQALRGLSRMGSPMMRRGQGAILDEALDGIERALT